MAKRLFYMSGAFLMLTLAYHMGATSAQGQTGGGDVSAVRSSLGTATAPDLVVTSSGEVFHGLHGPFGDNASWTRVGNVGSASPIVNVDTDVSDPDVVFASAYASNGDYFRSSDSGRTWSLRGNVFMATAARAESWGTVKARYR